MSRKTDLTAPAFVIGVVVVVVAVIGGVAVALVPTGGGSDAIGPVPTAAPRYEPVPTEEPTDTFPTDTLPPDTLPTDTLPTEDPTPAGPDGYQTVAAPGGLTVHIPGDWPVKDGAVPSNLQADDPGADCLLRFGGDTADDRPLLAVVSGFETHTPSIKKAYHRLQLTQVTYGQADDAVDWEFTFTSGTGPRHAYGRYWRTGGTDYVAYGSCATGAWTQFGEVLSTLLDTADPQ